MMKPNLNQRWMPKPPKKTLVKKLRKIKRLSKLTLLCLELKKCLKMYIKMVLKKLKNHKKTWSRTLKTTFLCLYSS